MNESGMCLCGCGEQTKLAKQTWEPFGWVKGEPLRYIAGHMKRSPSFSYSEEDRGYDTECWIWRNGSAPGGYGQISIGNKTFPAHRAMYERLRGPIPPDIDHLCYVPRCVNPDHLEPVTPLENVRRQRNTKLTFERACQIRDLVKDGWRKADVARAYGIAPSTLTQVIRGDSWKQAA